MLEPPYDSWMKAIGEGIMNVLRGCRSPAAIYTCSLPPSCRHSTRFLPHDHDTWPATADIRHISHTRTAAACSPSISSARRVAPYYLPLRLLGGLAGRG